ncbi:MAG: hypothetical protein ACJAVL_001941 [Bacteroidia bacterium]|jgi:hypothetical protein
MMPLTHIFRYTSTSSAQAIPIIIGTLNMTQRLEVVILSDFDFSKLYRRIKPFEIMLVNLL